MNRRNLLIAGTAASASVLLYGCSSGSEEADTETVGQADVSTDPSSETGSVALYDGSEIEPVNDQPINNPDGWVDRALGGVDADVTVIEYVSPTCPHCAAFHASAYPQIKEAYIDTGAIRFIARPFRRNVLDLAVFMVAAAGGNAYYDILAAYMASQNEWMSAENPREAIFAVAQQFGFTQERFEEILTDQELFDGLEATREQALNEFGLTGTPTFYINGDKYEGTYDFEGLSAAIEERA
ncbi:DsbA family protein [Pelagibacterium xiamenense]|uniref:DsbA family protein n=1 Tax=Pelagibacterium xiamenense TaxID=2901140 RepID=UPI001E37F1A9|nr:thioredoxin domain-containing protein [Pelagibacterium xiamenense]MCD7060439.1 DsbA family protein [Pelagibacterium xiamenense]